jgi:hypothetical protein
MPPSEPHGVRARLERLSIPEPNTGCFLWLGSVTRRGYATMTLNRKTQLAHRIAYEAVYGSIPEGLHIDHRCRVRCCINPAHLEAVTITENNRRAFAVAAPRPLKTHCKQGHPFSGDNV